jgi:hypothetical protein
MICYKNWMMVDRLGSDMYRVVYTRVYITSIRRKKVAQLISLGFLF